MTTLNFGKYKGQEIENVAQTKDGRAWLTWLLEQPIEGQYAVQNNARNKKIREVLEQELKPKPTVSFDPQKREEKVPENMLINTELKVINVQLDVINKKTDKILTYLSRLIHPNSEPTGGWNEVEG